MVWSSGLFLMVTLVRWDGITSEESIMQSFESWWWKKKKSNCAMLRKTWKVAMSLGPIRSTLEVHFTCLTTFSPAEFGYKRAWDWIRIHWFLHVLLHQQSLITSQPNTSGTGAWWFLNHRLLHVLNLKWAHLVR